MGRKVISVWLVLSLLFGFLIIIDVNMEVIPKVGAATLYVDDDYVVENATHKKTIQAAVDAAQPGDTVFVYNGTYKEVVITKTLTLIGEDCNNTIINQPFPDVCIWVFNADYTSISGFTFQNSGLGIHIEDSNHIDISNNKMIDISGTGISIERSNHTKIENNDFNTTMSICIEAFFICYNQIINNTFINNYCGIFIQGDSYENTIAHNQVISNCWGIWLAVDLHHNIIKENILQSNKFAMYLYESDMNVIEDNSFSNNNISVKLRETNGTNLFVNNSINSSYDYDIEAGTNSYDIFLNTTFDKTNTHYLDTLSLIEVQWYLHLNVTNSLGQPVPYATVCIKDNQYSLPSQKYTTDPKGVIQWLVQTEYIEQDIDNDTMGEKTFFTPHKITAWNETLMGYSEVNMNESKEVNVVLDTPYHEIPLYKGWNMISLPLVQSDTSISTVLGSIAGNYDKVEWYNTSEGIWHTTDDDLTDLDHTIGFWIHMKTDDTLIVTGDIPNTTSIQLYHGWNLIGNPSFCIHGFDEIYASINGNYTAVQWFDAGDKGDSWKHYQIDKPQELNDLKYVTCGRGYWIYIDQDCVWEVNNF